MTHFLRLFVPALLVMSAYPGPPGHAALPAGLLQLAQNTMMDEAAPQDITGGIPAPADTSTIAGETPLPAMPPMPPAKLHLSTEKPVPELPVSSAAPVETTGADIPDTQPMERSGDNAGTATETPQAQVAESVPDAGFIPPTGEVQPEMPEQADASESGQLQAEPGMENEPHTMYDPAELAASEQDFQASEQGQQADGTQESGMLDDITSGVSGAVEAAADAAGAAGTAAGAAAGAAGTAAQAAAPVIEAGQAAQATGEQQPGTQTAPQEVAVLPPQSSTPATSTPARTPSPLVMQELSLFNVPTANLRTVKIVIDEEYNLRGMVYGEETGYLRKLEADSNGDFREVWKSPPLNAPVREVFVEDIDDDGVSEIVAYTGNGNIFIFRYNTHEQVYRTPEGAYENIRCMIIANLDNDPQKELFFLATRSGTLQQDDEAGNLIQFDSVSQFDEWTSSDLYAATDMVYGNVDSDDEMEIILNTGEILSQRFKTIKWKSDIEFGSRLYLIDLDDDGILELVTEYNQSYVRIFDIDRRQEKW